MRSIFFLFFCFIFIKGLPVTIDTLQQLESGQLSSNYRASQQLEPITRLKISAELTEFPQEVFELADYLEILDLSDNFLTELPSDLDRLVNLRILFLSNNDFTTIPSALASCPKLEMISFKSNKLTAVDENVLPIDTRWLILTDNQITKLPISMGRLHRLQKLALAGNCLTEFPKTMEHCKNLELARLSANKLTSMPDWLFKLPKLSWLAFSGNVFNQTELNDCSIIAPTVQKVSLSEIQLGELIGEGASGYIYRARWIDKPESISTQDLDIAVKVFKGNVTSDGYPEDELDCCLTVGDHNALIKVIGQLDQQDKDQTSGIIMELIDSEFYNLGLPPSLSTCTRDTFDQGVCFTPKDIYKVGSQLLDGLCHLHEQGISHGDIYAHNTMINADYDLLFGDFGAATNLMTLPDTQQQAMERIEVRAWCCVLDDMLNLASKKLADQKERQKEAQDEALEEAQEQSIYVLLKDIIAQGMQEDVLKRPSLRELQCRLSVNIL